MAYGGTSLGCAMRRRARRAKPGQKQDLFFDLDDERLPPGLV